MDRIPADEEKIEKALDALKKRKVKLSDTEPGYAAQVGDSAFVNMKVWNDVPMIVEMVNVSSECIHGPMLS